MYKLLNMFNSAGKMHYMVVSDEITLISNAGTIHHRYEFFNLKHPVNKRYLSFTHCDNQEEALMIFKNRKFLQHSEEVAHIKIDKY